MLKTIIWLCVSLVSPEGTLMSGHTWDYKAEVLVSTSEVIPNGCSFYKINAQCEKVIDPWAHDFVVTYLCNID